MGLCCSIYTRRQIDCFGLGLDDDLVRCNSSDLLTFDDIPLHKVPNVPHYLHDNPFITHGYRVSLSFKQCLQSAFMWNNETINIWSHFLGFMAFFLIMLYVNVMLIPSLGGTFLDHAITSTSLICSQICMLCSSGYHMFSCHSQRANQRWLLIDMTGISFALIGIYLPGVHYAFYCRSIWRDVYFISIAFLAAAALMTLLFPHPSSPWVRYRIWLFAGLVSYGIIPTIHWIFLNGGFGTHIVQEFAPKVFFMYTISLISFILYLTKIPERFFPGQFDYIGSSHQLWHVGMVAAFLWWYKSGVEFIQYRLTYQC